MAALEAILEKARNEPVTERELEKVRNEMLYSIVEESLTAEPRASALGRVVSSTPTRELCATWPYKWTSSTAKTAQWERPMLRPPNCRSAPDWTCNRHCRPTPSSCVSTRYSGAWVRRRRYWALFANRGSLATSWSTQHGSTVSKALPPRKDDDASCRLTIEFSGGALTFQHAGKRSLVGREV